MIFWTILGSFLIFIGLGLLLVYWDSSGEESSLLNEAEEKLEAGDSEEAISILKRAVEFNPDNAKGRWELAKVLQQTGEYKEAGEHLRYSLENDSYPDGMQKSDALFRLAQNYEKNHDNQEAISTWSEFLEQNPDSTEAHFRRGKLFLEQHEIDQALNDFMTIEEDHDESPDLLSLFIGRCLYRKEHYKKAYDFYEGFLDSNPGHIEARMEMASLSRKLDQTNEARSQFKEIIEEGRFNQKAEALVQLITLARDENEIQRAEKLLDRLEKLRAKREIPETIDLHGRYQKAKLLDEQDQSKEAMDVYRSIYKKQPEFRDVERIVDEYIQKIDPEYLLEDYKTMNQENSIRSAEKIVKELGLKVMNTNSLGPNEVNVTARDQAESPKTNEVLIAFKRWDNTVGEWSLREFELQLTEENFDRGIFVTPGGFQENAKQYVEHSSIRLIGPDTLLQYLKEVEKKDL